MIFLEVRVPGKFSISQYLKGIITPKVSGRMTAGGVVLRLSGGRFTT